MAENKNSFDKEITTLIRKYKSEEENEGIDIPLEEISMWGFSMKLPAGLEKMREEIKKVIFPMNTRPPVVKTDEKMECRFLFSRIAKKENAEESRLSDKISRALDECGKQIVVYEKGILQAVNTEVEWTDYKMICLDGGLYGLIYLFDADTEYIMGGFQCQFDLYDQWKPRVLELLKYIRIEGGRSAWTR